MTTEPDAPEPVARRMLDRLRRGARKSLNALERRLHSRRRRKARELLRSRPIWSALFVCHGNVCRSPFAQYVFVEALERAGVRDISARSAGFIGPSRQSPRQALEAAQQRGVRMDEHRSQLLANDLVEDSDLIVVMAAEQADEIQRRFRPAGLIVILGDLDPGPIDQRTILDPWGKDDQAFADSYDRIIRCVNEMVGVIAA